MHNITTSGEVTYTTEEGITTASVTFTTTNPKGVVVSVSTYITTYNTDENGGTTIKIVRH